MRWSIYNMVVAIYVAFLRAINVGGRRITNHELKSSVVSLGFDDVSIYQASGNVIFSSDLDDFPKLEKTLEEGLQQSLGYEVPSYVRPIVGLQELAELEPFTNTEVGSDSKPQVAFLETKPDAGSQAEAKALIPADDRLEFCEDQFVWLPAGGISRSELDHKALAEIVGPYTVRTQGTIKRIVAKFL